MGKKIIPPHDPERLARVMDEKNRMIGVKVNELTKQAAERRKAEELELQQKQEEEYRQAQLDLELQRRRAVAEATKKKVATKVAEQQRKQMVEKKAKDEHIDEVYSNKIDTSYFKQFGTSHR